MFGVYTGDWLHAVYVPWCVYVWVWVWVSVCTLILVCACLLCRRWQMGDAPFLSLSRQMMVYQRKQPSYYRQTYIDGKQSSRFWLASHTAKQSMQ